MGDILGITTYFNPSKYKSKLKNYNKFFNNISKQGLKLLCIEVAFDEQNFELTKDHADILVQLRGNSVLWQKERILNLAIERLPSDCHQVIWLDNDIIFENDDWLIEASLTLKKHKVLQPFQFVRRLGESEHCKQGGAALKKSFAGGGADIFLDSGRSKIYMYKKEQKEHSLKEYERLGSVQATITYLGYPLRHTLYDWHRNMLANKQNYHGSPNKLYQIQQKYINAPEHPLS